MAEKKTKASTKPMTKAHKEALAEGRRNAHSVKIYLEALNATRPKRGRKRTPKSIKAQLAAVDAELAEADPLQELLLVQRRRDLEAALEALEQTTDIAPLERGFVEHAASYARNKGISYASFREVGVPADVLKRAGISRSR